MRNPSVRDLFDLSGRVAVVTGAGGYLGGAIASALAELGASVVATSRDAAKARAAADALPRVGDAVHRGVAMNHLDPADVQRAFAEVERAAGRVDVLVNNAHDRVTRDWHDVSPEEFAKDLANCTAFFTLARLVRNHAAAADRPASIINVGSMYGLVGSYPPVYEGICAASPASYHATKGAVVHLTRHLAVYWAKDRVRVNCLCPGAFPFPDADPRLIGRLNDRIPLGRIGQAWEVKGAAAFLASDAGSYVTGQMMVVDGGWTAW